MSDKVALVRLRAKNEQYDQAMRKSRQETQGLSKSGDDVAKSSGRMAAGFKLAASAGAVLFARDAVKASSDLAESQSKVGVVFGESADEVARFGETSAQAIGQSENQALAAAGTFGNLFRSIGLTEEQSAKFSTTMTTLASDLASFNNTSVDEALTALRSGLVGETEPLKRFGVNLNEATLKAKALEMGLSDGKAVLDANAKAQAAYAIIMEQTTLAQGDFARTSDGLANKQRIAAAEFENLKATLGNALIPAMKALTGAGTDVMRTFDAMPGPLQATVIAAAALALVGPRISSAWASVAESMGNARVSLGSTVAEVGRLKSAGVGIAAGVAAYHATYAALEQLASTSVDVSQLADDLEHLGTTGTGLDDVFGHFGGAEEMAHDLALVRQEATDSNWENATDLARSFGQGWGATFEALGHGKANEAKKNIEELDAALVALARTDPSAAAENYRQLAAALLEQGIPLETIVSRFPQYLGYLDSSAGKQRSAAAATEEHNRSLEEQWDRYADLYDLRSRAADADMAVNDAVMAVAEAEQAVSDALDDERDAAEGVADANRAVAEARRGVSDALEQVEQARRGVSDAMRSEAEAAEAVTDAIEDQRDAEEALAQARREAAGDSDAMRDALEGVADAQDRLTEAQQNTADAQRDLDQATMDYADTLAGLERDAAGAEDDVLSAEIRLRKARAALADLGADGDPVSADDRLAAEIAIREAERRLADAREAAAAAMAEVDANNDGAAASEAVVAASEAVEDAKKDEQAALENLEGAVQTVADTQVEANENVAAAEQTLAEKIEAVQDAQQRRIDAHQGVIDAQAAVQKAAEGVRDAEAQVRDRLGEVGAAQQALNDAKQATVDARGEIADAERDVRDALFEQAKAHYELDVKTRGAERAQKDFAEALQSVLNVMDPNDPKYQAMMLYLAALERFNRGGLPAQQTVPPIRPRSLDGVAAPLSHMTMAEKFWAAGGSTAGSIGTGNWANPWHGAPPLDADRMASKIADAIAARPTVHVENNIDADGLTAGQAQTLINAEVIADVAAFYGSSG